MAVATHINTLASEPIKGARRTHLEVFPTSPMHKEGKVILKLVRTVVCNSGELHSHISMTQSNITHASITPSNLTQGSSGHLNIPTNTIAEQITMLSNGVE